MSYQPDIFVYHDPCDDGFAAAWAVHRRWGDAVEYVPTNYGRPTPDFTGKHVLVGDFSWKADAFKAIAASAASVMILDHHKTAEAELKPWRVSGDFSADVIESWWDRFPDRPHVSALFNMDKSGARMTWEFCFPGQPAPWLIRLVEDRDLWRFDLDQTEAFTTFLRSHSYNFDDWSEINDYLEDDVGHKLVMKEARGIRRFYEAQVAKLADSFYFKKIAGHAVPSVNCHNQFASDVAHELLRRHPAAPFAATWSVSHESTGFSLRSEDHREDVSEIARRFGGGGHRNAAGFSVPRP